jgi:hypothetical protein
MISTHGRGSLPHGRQGKIQPPRTDVSDPAMSHFPQLYHLPVVYSNFESISGLIHSLSRSPHNLLISGNALIDMPSGVLH